MAKTKTKQEEGIEILEDPGALAHKAEEFFSSKRNRNLVFGIGGTIAAVVAAFIIYKFYITNQNIEAQQEMFQAVYYFEADSLGKALNGDGINYGFLDISEDYAGTEAANLANFYIGAIYLQLGQYDNSVRYLNDFSSDDWLVQARAYALTGDAYMELENYTSAAEYYDRASNYKPNEFYTPIYLQKLAIAEENQGNYGAAAEAYGRIVDEFVNSTLVQEAKKHKARLLGLAAE